MFKFTGFYLRTGPSWRPYLQGVQRDVELVGSPIPSRIALALRSLRESLGSLRAYYYNPHNLTISQSYCSLCMPKAKEGMLRIIAFEILEPGKFMEDNGDKNAVTPFDSRSRVI